MIPPAISSGRFGHQKVTIESPQFGDAGAMGDIAQSWLPIAENVPAEVTWLRGNKLLAARAVHAEATAEVWPGAGCEQAAKERTTPKAASSAMTRPDRRARLTRPAPLRGVVEPGDGPGTAHCGPTSGGRR